jgi:glutamate racemase
MNKVIAFLILISVPWCHSVKMSAQKHTDPGNLSGRKEITLVITDSGLGGISVMEDIAVKIKESGCFKKVNLVFVNALFDENTGYNSFQTKKEKTGMFDRVLTAIENRYHPDAILIGCNTLSVIYDGTAFSGLSKTPVIGIVEAGIELIANKLKADPSSRVIIFGTETTIEEDSHRQGLLKLGIGEERIVTKACPQLQSYIEQDPASEQTEMLISVYMNEALDELNSNDGSVYISLNCSHFGYSGKLWKKAAGETSFRIGGILDPNSSMSDVITEQKCPGRYDHTRFSFLVTSRVRMPNAATIAGYFEESSPEIADALRNYKLIPDLF